MKGLTEVATASRGKRDAEATRREEKGELGHVAKPMRATLRLVESRGPTELGRE